jgi:hypothetical protein
MSSKAIKLTKYTLKYNKGLDLIGKEAKIVDKEDKKK